MRYFQLVSLIIQWTLISCEDPKNNQATTNVVNPDGSFQFG